MPIFVKHSNKLLRRATANMMFDGQKCVYISVSHVFSNSASGTQNTRTSYDSDYDFGSGTEDENSDEEYMDVTSRASISSPDEILDDRSDSSSPTSGSPTLTYGTTPIQFKRSPKRSSSAAESIHTHLPSKQELNDSSALRSAPSIESLEFFGTLTQSSVDQDWALIEITNKNVSSSIKKDASIPRGKYSCVAQSARAAQIVAYTSHISIYGQLLENTTYMRLPGSVTFQEVYIVELDDSLDWGDCGAGVFDAVTAELYGHIVASSETRNIAYVMAAHRVFEAIRAYCTLHSFVGVGLFLGQEKNQGQCHL